MTMSMMSPLLILFVSGNKIPYTNMQAVLKKRFIV